MTTLLTTNESRLWKGIANMPLVIKQDFVNGLKIKKELTYSPDRVGEYNSLFNELKNSEIIRRGTKFEGERWIVWNIGLKVCNFTFELPFHLRKWVLPLKAWVLYQLKKSINKENIRTKLNIGKEIIINSWGFSDISGLTQYYENTAEVKQDVFKSVADELLEFIELGNHLASKVRNIYKSKRKNKRQRQLPAFSEIVKFHEAMERLAFESSDLERRKYSPLILWWRLTNIIPMRPREFVLTPNDCIVYKGEEYFFRVRRTKHEGKNDDDEPIIDEVPITLEAVQWIRTYKELTTPYPQTEYLLSYMMHDDVTDGKSGVKSKNHVFTTDILRLLLDSFYVDIMHKKYGITSESYEVKDHRRIQLMGTRHLAICNMLFMNFSPHTIKVLAGHEHIHSQNPYAAHMDLYVQSQVTMLSETFQRAIRRISASETFNIDQIPSDLKNRRMYKIEDFSHLWSLPHGCFCLYTPLNCPVDDHRYCPYLYIPNENWEGALGWLTDCSDRLEAEIKVTLDFLRDIRIDPAKRGESNNAAGKLNTLVHQKALVDAQCKELEYGRKVTHKDKS
ncbi:hypothetical protein MO973_24615 [Paenibacillus sp. TRM 82003]|nr:hypothetical protein [Paenibacillus sp. TRM 82003]MCI3923415.1 hypothetical protein [Paenibacillus sp. TRM 82003]